MSADVRITAEPIDNGRCKFLVSEPLHAGGVRRFASPDEARGSPLAEAIFAIPGADVSEVVVSGNLVTVGKRSPAPWPVVGKAVGQAIRAALAGGQPAVTSKPAAPAGRGSTTDDALYERVADLFESQVNPMVARHGGRVELIDVQDAVVMVRMAGGCQGCGMADVTLRQGIEAMLHQHVPEVKGIVDFADPTHAAAQAREFARAHPVHGVVAVDDDTAVVAAAIAEALGLRGNPVPAAAAARDKHQQRQLLAGRGVAVPRFELLATQADPGSVAPGAPYPCVLKPLRLSASRGVIRADTPAEFVAAFERIKRILEQTGCARSILVEEFVPGCEVAVEGLVTQGALQVLALFDKPDPLDGPFFEETIYVTPSRLARTAQQEIAACAQAAVDALGLRDGPIHAEVRHNDRGAWLIELAARPIGGRCSGALRFEIREAGNGKRETSLEEIIIRHALGMELPTLERERRASGVMMIPVPGAGVLRDVRGVGAAQAVPLVEEVVITMHPGQPLVPWPEGSRYPGFIFARGGTSEAVEAALRAAHARLEFLTEPAD